MVQYHRDLGQGETLDQSNSETNPKGDVISTAPRFRLPAGARRAGLIAGVLLLLALIGVAGIAYAGYDYSKRYDGKILPGATIAGVDVGGMTSEDALAEVKAAIAPQLHHPVTVTWKHRTWTVTPKELGARSNARAAIDAALQASDAATFLEKTRMRLLGDELSFDREVAVSYPRRGVHRFIERLAAKLHRDPVDASLDYSTGWVKVTPEQTGRSVNVVPSEVALKRAIKTGDSHAQLSVRPLEPAMTAAAYDQVLLVRIGENKLYLYENGKITSSWTIATGLPEYPTPSGVYEVTEKRYMPTWINPAPDTWGKDMPESIPPGPSNPLGLRALNWSAPAIRFHGTSATYSLGFNASHGCVRLANEDVIELYDRVDVGTPIVSVEVAPYRPLYTSSSSDPVPTAENTDSEEREETVDGETNR